MKGEVCLCFMLSDLVYLLPILNLCQAGSFILPDFPNPPAGFISLFYLLIGIIAECVMKGKILLFLDCTM